MNRRQLLKRTLSAGAGVLGFPYFVRSTVLGKDGAVAPSEQVTYGCIGVGPQGRHNIMRLLECPEARIIAVCDVKKDARNMARQIVDRHFGNTDCLEFLDYRELLARQDIDAVIIASTDHWHIIHAVDAARAGKDMYVEKPLGLAIQDAKILRETIKRQNRVFQFGTQQRSSPQFRAACELVLNGRIGKVHTIRVSAPAGADQRSGSRMYQPEAIPEGFDYEFWLGPAPYAPYTPKRVVNPHWFHISDYSLGYIAGWGIHHVDIAQWGNGSELTGPVEVEGTAVFPDDDALCDTVLSWEVDLQYANGVRVNFTSDGGKNPHGIRFEGSEGWVYVNRETIDAHPKSLLKESIGPDGIHLPVSQHHQRNLLESVKSRRQPICPIDVAVRSETLCHLSDIAVRLGRKLRWDPASEEFVDDASANRMLKRAMREPWRL
jgi:predicted dehydrogenase